MSELSPQYANYLEQLAASKDLADARRRCAQFLRMTADSTGFSGSMNTPEGLLSAMLSGETLDGDPLFSHLTGRVYRSYTLCVAMPDSEQAVPESPELPGDCWWFPHLGRLILVSASSTGPVNMDRVTALLRRHRLSGGVSRPFFSLSQLCEAYDQALSTLRTLRLLGRNHTVAFYDDFLMIRLLELVPDSAPLGGFCLPDIQALREYDKLHDSELCRTLLCYLEHARNATSTARELSVHRNTVHYRIGKCMEVMPGLDFKNDYVTFLLMLSLHIAEYDDYRRRIHQIL